MRLEELHDEALTRQLSHDELVQLRYRAEETPILSVWLERVAFNPSHICIRPVGAAFAMATAFG